MTTATLDRRFSLPAPRRPSGRAFFFSFLATVALALFMLSALSVGIALGSQGKLLPNVNVGGVPVGGLSRDAAAERLRAELPSLSEGQVTIRVNGEEARIGYGEIGRDYDLDAMLDAAFSVGRSGGPISEGIARLRTLVFDASVPLGVHPFDSEALERAAADASARFAVEPVDASAAIEGAEIVVHEATIGQAVDPADIREAMEPILATTDPASAEIELRSTIDEPKITTEEAEAAADSARAMIADLPLVIGEGDAQESFPISAAEIRQWISFGPVLGADYGVRLDEAGVRAAVEAVREGVDRDPVNATFIFDGPGVGSVIGGTDGRALDVNAMVEAVLEALRQRGEGDRVTQLPIVADVTEPAITTEMAQAAFSQMTLLGSWTTYYVPEEGNHFGNNINIPAYDINGKVLAPGEWFSFWGSVGPITPERGFGYGGVIINGRSVRGGAIGGGICSTSTTLFNAAMRAGLQMGIRANHYYYIPRYPTGLDATVYMDDTYVQDMTFRNDTAYPILIRGYGGTGFVTFEVYGVPDGRSVVLSDATTWNHGTATDTTVVSADLAPGTAQRVEYPHDGFDASVTRWVYAANGSVMHQDTWFSSYRVVNGVTLVGASGASEASTQTAETPAEGQGEVPPAP